MKFSISKIRSCKLGEPFVFPIDLRKARFYPTYPILAENHISSKNNKMLRTIRLPKTPAKTDKVPRAHIILENQIEGFVYFK